MIRTNTHRNRRENPRGYPGMECLHPADTPIPVSAPC